MGDEMSRALAADRTKIVALGGDPGPSEADLTPTPPAPADTGAGDLIEEASPADTLRELRERVEWYANERTAVMHALVPECPAYPGVPNCCDECVCDCGAADSGQLVRIINDDRTARQQAERERDALRADTAHRIEAEATERRGRVAAQEAIPILRAQRDAAIMLAEEAIACWAADRDGDSWEQREDIAARLATLRGEG